MFTVDCQCDNVDIVFTENETNSLHRHRVLHKRQLKPYDGSTICAEMTKIDQPVSASYLTQPADTSPSAVSASTTIRACLLYTSDAADE